MILKIQKRGKTSDLLSLISVFLFFIFSLVDASLLPFQITKQTTSQINANFSNQIVHFQRFIKINNDSEKLILDTINEEIFLIEKNFEQPLKLRCFAILDNFFGNLNDSILETSWLLDDGTILSSNEIVVILKPTKEIKVRCQARLSNIFNLPNGTVLSRSIQFRRKKPFLFEIEPRVFHAMPKSGVRLVCRWPLEIAESVIWKLNGKELEQTKNIKFGGTRGKSVLHILHANGENAGEYRCLPSNSTDDLKDQPSEVVIDETAPEWPGVELPEMSFGPIGGEAILECFSPRSRGYRWTLERPHFPEKNESLTKIETMFLSNSSILVLKNISKEMSGVIRCTIENVNGTLKTATTEFKALDSSLFNFDKISLARITKKQGIAMNFRCETFDLLGETPEMATWYVNSKPIEKSPYIKIVKTEQQGIGYADLLIGIAEKEFSGIYSCIISNKRHERIKQLIFSVDVTTNETLSNLKISTDHEEKCMRLEFDLPESTELSWAHFTTYFIVVYKANDTESLNSLPSMAKCNYKGHCNIELCSETTELEESTEYVFRISMVLSGTGTVITPLSIPTKAWTWDACAKKSLPLNIIFLEDENALEIQWKKPDKDIVRGRVVSYVFQLANYSDKMTNLLVPVQREYYERDVFNRNFRIENVTKPFAFKFRVTPITRSRKLPLMNMQLIEFFPFLLFTSSDDSYSLIDPMILAPNISAEQMNLLPIVIVKWKKSENEFNKIIFRFQNILNFRSKFIVVEKLSKEEKLELTNGIEPGFVYQICAAFVRKEDKAHGIWNCLTIPVKNQYNNLAFSNEKDAVKKSQLPFPIDCEKSNCRCLTSFSGNVRVEWNKQENLIKSKINHIVHYTLDETDPNSENIQMPVSIGDSFVELSSLFPNTTYRIMIETINEFGDSVVGKWFNCKTPSELSIPPPKHFGYTLLNSTHVEFHWIPLNLVEDESFIDGYTLFWHREGLKEKNIFIPDATSESYILKFLRPLKNYYVSIASHSPITGNSKYRSDRLIVTLPQLTMNIVSDTNYNEKSNISSFRTEDLMFRIALISAVTTVSLFLLLLMSALCYFCCFLRFQQWRQEREQQRILQMRSNASSALSLKSEEDHEIGQISSTREILPLLQLPPDPPGFNDDPYRNDTKGPAGGPRPLGNKRYLKMMQDPEFLQRIAEMNRDPTGLGEGVSACSRDKYLMELHKEEDRIVQEISARQRAAIAKRKKEFEEKRKFFEKEKNLKKNKKMKENENDQNLETLFIGNLKLNCTNFEEMSSLSQLKQNFQNLASHSLTELNKSSKGLSNRSFSVSFYQKIFPKKRPSFLSSISKLTEQKMGEIPLLNSPSNGSNQFENHPSASSLPNLPNLTDSGIFCFDDGSNGSNFGKICDRSGSATLIDELSTPMADKPFFVNLNDFRQHFIDQKILLP